MRVPTCRPRIATAALIIVLVAAAWPAAAGNSTEARWRHACWADAFSMCTLHAIGGERRAVRDCLLRNFDRLSRACKAVFNEAKAEGVRGLEPPPEPPGPPANPHAEP
jgi:hypothetical protein